MLSSLLVAADILAITRSNARTLCSSFLDSYSASLASGKAYWVESETAQGLIRELLDGLRYRRRSQLINTRSSLKGKKRAFKVDGKKTLSATGAQRAAVTEFMIRFALAQPQLEFFSVLDVARRIAGTGSLGVNRYAILVNGKGPPGGHYLLDLKQSLGSSVAAHFEALQPKSRSQAHRAVEVQLRMQAVSVALLQPVRFDDSAYVLRELQPAEDRVTLDGSRRTMGEVNQVLETIGRPVAWAQLRSAGRDGSAIADELIEFGMRKKWKSKLITAAQVCAAQVRKDSRTFNTAFDDGVFST